MTGLGELRWTDMFAVDILTLHPDEGTVTRQQVADVLAAFRPRTGGGMVTALRQIGETSPGRV
ncbi:hypothetical protein [Micromonospora marina]|uniref:hypothetical protein n=1 Tax=Micromonospora marina TaxID=307120 RepID=UPI0034530037